VLKILFPDTILATMESPIITPHNEAQHHNSKGKKLSPKLYDSILTHVNMLWPNKSFWHHNNLPHPPNAHITNSSSNNTHNPHRRSYSTFSMHSGGSSLSYLCRDGTVDAGFIVSMWTQVLMGVSCLFIIMAPHALLSADDMVYSPYVSWPGFLSTVVYSQPTTMQAQEHVISRGRSEVMLHTMTAHLVHLASNQESEY
jgi:hypothetical protein